MNVSSCRGKISHFYARLFLDLEHLTFWISGEHAVTHRHSDRKSLKCCQKNKLQTPAPGIHDDARLKRGRDWPSVSLQRNHHTTTVLQQLMRTSLSTKIVGTTSWNMIELMRGAFRKSQRQLIQPRALSPSRGVRVCCCCCCCMTRKSERKQSEKGENN